MILSDVLRAALPTQTADDRMGQVKVYALVGAFGISLLAYLATLFFRPADLLAQDNLKQLLGVFAAAIWSLRIADRVTLGITQRTAIRASATQAPSVGPSPTDGGSTPS